MRPEQPIVNLRKNPSQARSVWTIELILQAAAQVLEGRGEEAVTTKSVAERAGVSIGTLYQYFSNRDAILVALASRETRRVAERARALVNQIDPANAPDRGRLIIKALIRSYAGRRGAKRQFALMAAMRSEDGGPRLRAEFAELLAQTWDRSNAGGEPAINKVYAYTMTNAILGVLHAAAIESSPVLKEPDLEEALFAIAVALSPRARNPSHREQSEPASATAGYPTPCDEGRLTSSRS